MRFFSFNFNFDLMIVFEQYDKFGYDLIMLELDSTVVAWMRVKNPHTICCRLLNMDVYDLLDIYRRFDINID